MTDLEQRLGYAFRDPALLSRALTHRSHGAEHNERLEFVGDAVLNCVVAAALFRRFPQLPEGDLSRIRANLVNRDCLLQRAQDLGMAGLVRLGEGELRSGGASRPSILSDATEAVFGAVFLDGGFESARVVIEQCYAEAIQAVDPGVSGKDLPALIDEMKARLGSGAVLLIADTGAKPAVAAGVTADLTAKLSAVTLVKAAAEAMGGKGGGGRPDMAQAGGTQPENLAAALASVPAWVAGKL